MENSLRVRATLLDFRADSDHESLDLLAQAAVAALPSSNSVDCIVTFPRPVQAFLTAGTSHRAVGLARWDQEDGEGPMFQALAGQSSLILNGYSTNPRWPTYSENLAQAGHRSLVSVPLELGPGRISALTLVAAEDDVFTPAAPSSHRNVKARVVAETILSDLPGGTPTTHLKA